MSLLNKIQKKLTEACPIGKGQEYGGIPGGGGFDSNTEYEIGAQTIAESLHCILGSLQRTLKQAKELNKDPMSIIGQEKNHIKEELNIIKNALQEYRNDIYISLDTFKSKYGEQSLLSMRNIAPKLKQLAIQKQKDVETEGIIGEVAKQCYQFLIYLADAIMKSVQVPGRKIFNNAFKDVELNFSVSKLQRLINKLYSETDI